MQSREVARFRARTLAFIREFFDERGYLEVEVPLLAPSLVPEAHIEVFRTELLSPSGEAEPRFLIPSPEVWMKQLIADGSGSIYYLGKCFRNGESRSRLHRAEFTMLEWYTVGETAPGSGGPADYLHAADLTDDLLRHLFDRLAGIPEGPARPECRGPAERITMEEAFVRYAGASPGVFGRSGGIRETAERLGLRCTEAEHEEELFQRVFLTGVEPALPTDRPVILMDYPAFVPTLARRKAASGSRSVSCERWELYLAGMEVANCYTEERDAEAIRSFLLAETPRKAASLVPHPTAFELEQFAAAPPVSGVALGVDRLVMALLGLRDIAGVIFFP